MKFFKKLSVLPLLCGLICCCCSLVNTSAASEVCSYPANYLTLSIPEGTLVMTQDTSEYDEVWEKAGVSNPSDKLDEFEDMNVVAAYYDPITQTTVSFICKQSSDTVATFTFAGMTGDEIVDYIYNAMGEVEDLDISASLYPQAEADFFRMELDVLSDSSPATEIVYGTLINGQMLQFDLYSEGSGQPDESFLRSIVDSVSFTRVMTYEEYQAESAASFRKFLAIIGLIILVFVLLVLISKQARRHKSDRSKKISDKMQSYRERRRAGQIDLDSPAAFTAACTYDKDALETFSLYNTWFRNLPSTIAWVAILLALIIMMMNNGSTIYALITAAVGVILLYSVYSRGEKKKAVLLKQYDIKLKPEAAYKFYSEYFTVSGLGSVTDYIYPQITSLRSFRGYVYLYFGDDLALIIDPSKVTGSDADDRDPAGRLLDYMRDKMK